MRSQFPSLCSASILNQRKPELAAVSAWLLQGSTDYISVSPEPPADRSAAQMKASFGSRAARGFERTRRSKILPGNTEPEVLNGGKYN